MTRGWFITGTDTGVGKTCVAEALLQALTRRGLRAVGMKPVASGSLPSAQGLQSDDAERLRRAGAVAADLTDINPYTFEPAIAPHLAAAQVGIEMRLETVRHHFDRLAARADWLIVEGAGGWCVPFDRARTMSDIARALALPVILVVGVRLGCISHALLTARAILADGLTFAGWVANRLDPTFDSASETITALEARLAAPLLAAPPFAADGSLSRCGDEVLCRLLDTQ